MTFTLRYVDGRVRPFATLREACAALERETTFVELCDSTGRVVMVANREEVVDAY